MIIGFKEKHQFFDTCKLGKYVENTYIPIGVNKIGNAITLTVLKEE
jgi:hypothetical protein